MDSEWSDKQVHHQSLYLLQPEKRQASLVAPGLHYLQPDEKKKSFKMLE